ncbi:unnamed protein product [Rodentolepis nana]|uniref:FHA domain-containing protein n=1 Tax=Rodentolepis nana TaxID=102285 RepID=A0A0R3TP86_RODNA|nr:unnamed protein product [Rodentolepis nana]
MAGGGSAVRKSQFRNKQRGRDRLDRQIDPPWRPEDDYLLINSTLVTCNLAETHACVKFTRPYSLTEVENRWRLLLFNPVVSKVSLEAILHLPEHVKIRLDTKIPFSNKEDAQLMTISYNDVFSDGTNNKYAPFERLLMDFADVFYSTRTPFHLYAQWNRLRGAHLILDDSHSRDNNPGGGDPDSFSDTEFLIRETAARSIQTGIPHLTDAPSISRRKRLLTTREDYQGFQACVAQAVADHLGKRQRSNSLSTIAGAGVGSVGGANKTISRSPTWSGFSGGGGGDTGDCADSYTATQDEVITESQRERYRRRRRLEAKMVRVKEEARRWVALVESQVADGREVADHQPIYPTLATLTGNRSRFLIKHKSVTFGRGASNFTPDIDLSCEDEASRISRCHGRIILGDNGVFFIKNLSKHPIQVDNKIVLKEHAQLDMLSGTNVTTTAPKNELISPMVKGSKEINHMEIDGEDQFVE